MPAWQPPRALLPRAFAHNRATLSEGGKPMSAAQAVALLEGRYARETIPAGKPAAPPPPATLVAQLAEIAPAKPEPTPAAPAVSVAEAPPDDPAKALACTSTANGIRCTL